ncbi:MAG: hypothetical protein HZY75_07005 [Nocardioidaceae bacterium]|nr:MAG: hypothetical protein HZY75_07005 [Nocardioidaceae bacterium]
MSSATSPLTRSSSGRPALLRLVLLLPAGVALLAGLDAAAMLLDVPAPIRLDRLPDVHGVLMVLGFVGTLIALERAVALGHRLGYLAPGLLGLGGLFLISPAPIEIGQALLVAGAVALIGVYLPLWRRQRDEAVLVQIIGAAAGLGAAMLWLGGVAVPELLGWLASFVILTIAGERLELARLAMGPRAGTIMVALSHCLLAALVATLLWPEIGTVLLGLVVLGMTGWLAQHDIARATIRQSGFPRYAAGCMLAGYAWLAIAGGIWLLGGPVADGVRYDAVVHAVFLGFTFSMIMAHAPVILPAVLRRPLPYHPALIGPVVLLHGSLVLRLWAGDGLGSQDAWVTGEC